MADIGLPSFLRTMPLERGARNRPSLPAALRATQAAGIYSEADFEVFLPAAATRCTDGGEIWHGGGSPPPCQISTLSAQRQGCRTPKTKILTQI